MEDKPYAYKVEKDSLNSENLEFLISNYKTLFRATKLLSLKRGQIRNFMIQANMIECPKKDIVIPKQNIDLLDIYVNKELVKGVLIVEDYKYVRGIKISFDKIFIRNEVINEIKNHKLLYNALSKAETKIDYKGGK